MPRVSSLALNTEEAARLRREYEAEGLDETQMASDPFTEFSEWLGGVVAAEIAEPNTFVLATADAGGRPSARAVLMKAFSDEGLVFYTNLSSDKSEDLKQNDQAAATFVWVPLHRQVRFSGKVVGVDDATADAYWEQRPRGAQIGALASDQSSTVGSRRQLEEDFERTAMEIGSSNRLIRELTDAVTTH